MQSERENIDRGFEVETSWQVCTLVDSILLKLKAKLLNSIFITWYVSDSYV